MHGRVAFDRAHRLDARCQVRDAPRSLPDGSTIITFSARSLPTSQARPRPRIVAASRARAAVPFIGRGG